MGLERRKKRGTKPRWGGVAFQAGKTWSKMPKSGH